MKLYLESCIHRSRVSMGGSSVSVDIAECWGVPLRGPRNLRQVQRRPEKELILHKMKFGDA